MWLKLWKIKDEKISGFSLIILIGISLSWDALDVSKFLTSLLISSNLTWENENRKLLLYFFIIKILRYLRYVKIAFNLVWLALL